MDIILLIIGCIGLSASLFMVLILPRNNSLADEIDLPKIVKIGIWVFAASLILVLLGTLGISDIATMLQY